MLTRKAIIIGSHGGYRNFKFLDGVSVDLENYANYLLSKPGGQWYKNEIKILDEPSSEEIISEIKQTNQAYVFIHFSGHGFTDIDSKIQYICLKDKDIEIASLVSSSKKQTIIIDSCREYSTHIADDFKAQLLLEEKLFADKKETRVVFNDAIEKSPEGIILVNSTKLNQSSGDDEFKGGHFTYSFIKTGRDWAKKQNNESVLELNRAVDSGKEIMQRIFLTNQTPSMSGQIRRLTFPPFAVK